MHNITTFTQHLVNTLRFHVHIPNPAAWHTHLLCPVLLVFILVWVQCSIHVEILSTWTLCFSFCTSFEFVLSLPVCRLMMSRENREKQKGGIRQPAWNGSIMYRLDATHKQHLYFLVLIIFIVSMSPSYDRLQSNKLFSETTCLN